MLTREFVHMVYRRTSVAPSRLGAMKIISSQRQFQSARVSFSRVPSPIYEISESEFSCCRSLKIENENNSLEKINAEIVPQKYHIWNHRDPGINSSQTE